jgi:hypothetical protein
MTERRLSAERAASGADPLLECMHVALVDMVYRVAAFEELRSRMDEHANGVGLETLHVEWVDVGICVDRNFGLFLQAIRSAHTFFEFFDSYDGPEIDLTWESSRYLTIRARSGTQARVHRHAPVRRTSFPCRDLKAARQSVREITKFWRSMRPVMRGSTKRVFGLLERVANRVLRR